MIQPIESFPVRVSAVSPIHIGSGETVDPKWFVWDGQKVLLLNPDKLMAQVVERNQVGQFEQFCLDPQARAGDFLTKALIPVPYVAAYKVVCPERPREILTFIKTRDRPFLPGSSLKGAIRSSLLRAFFLGSDEATLAEATKTLQKAVNRREKLPGLPLERLLFAGTKEGRSVSAGEASNYDLLRLLGISDSGRLATKTLQVLPVEVLSAQTNKTLAPKNFTLYPELLTPGWVFDVTVRLDLSLLLNNFGPDRLGLHSKQDWVLNFVGHCQTAARHLLEQERVFYDQHRRPRLAEWCERQLAAMAEFGPYECLLPIGWGSGYNAKTVTDLFDADLFEQVLESYRNTKRLGRPGGRGAWLGPDLSPKTRRVTMWKDEEVPLGWLKLKM